MDDNDTTSETTTVFTAGPGERIEYVSHGPVIDDETHPLSSRASYDIVSTISGKAQ